jgi:hypothetical protein
LPSLTADAAATNPRQQPNFFNEIDPKADVGRIDGIAKTSNPQGTEPPRRM